MRIPHSEFFASSNGNKTTVATSNVLAGPQTQYQCNKNMLTFVKDLKTAVVKEPGGMCTDRSDMVIVIFGRDSKDLRPIKIDILGIVVNTDRDSIIA